MRKEQATENRLAANDCLYSDLVTILCYMHKWPLIEFHAWLVDYFLKYPVLCKLDGCYRLCVNSQKITVIMKTKL